MARWDATELWAWVALTTLSVVLEQFPLPLPYGDERQVFSLVDAVWAAALLVAEPSVLTLTVAAGLLLGQAFQPWPLHKKAFNLGQHLIGITVAELVYQALAPASPTSPAAWGAAGAAMGALYVLNEMAVALVVSLMEGAPFWRVLAAPFRLTLMNWAGSLAIGLLGGVLWATAPLIVPLLLVPLALSYLTQRGWRARLRERDQMRDIAHTANAISEQGDLTKRVPETDERNEAELLAATINQMLDRLEAAFQRERRFISEASHELRTPLTICRGHLEVLGTDAPPQEVAETHRRVIGELAHMGRIVQDMATLAKAEHPEFLRPEQVPLDSFVDELAANAAPLLDGHLRVEPVPPGMVLQADPQRLTQALLNLLRNAALHAAGGSPVELRLVGEPDGVRFEVEDRGGGLPAGEEEGVFQPFRRLNTAVPGTGLGLAIVRGIAEAHGGSAGARNRPGYGVTFWLFVPWS
ncbi:MAG TPA: HAMP domain-containing sensor histidine kinase [Actinomycetes bacterium]|nr:HAMP domain-containing sensor histidine kinase [Actinomycetes bacterium]